MRKLSAPNFDYQLKTSGWNNTVAFLLIMTELMEFNQSLLPQTYESGEPHNQQTKKSH